MRREEGAQRNQNLAHFPSIPMLALTDRAPGFVWLPDFLIIFNSESPVPAILGRTIATEQQKLNEAGRQEIAEKCKWLNEERERP